MNVRLLNLVIDMAPWSSAARPPRYGPGRARLCRALCAAALLLLAAPGCRRPRTDDALQQVVSSHQSSVFLIITEFGLKEGAEVTFRRIASGTGFLVSGGRIVSNCHVVAPWTEAEQAEELQQASSGPGDKPREFFCRIWVHQAGGKAFRPVARLSAGTMETTLEDVYHAPLWRTDGPTPSLKVAGVYYGRSETRQADEDVAVVQVLPHGQWQKFQPLEFDPRPPSPLEPVVTIGYPLAGQVEDVLALQMPVRGATRRCLTNGVIESTLVCHEGQSGGPLLNARGRVVGIVASNLSPSGSELLGLFSAPEHLVNFAVPAARAQELLARIENRQPVWDGQVDYGSNAKCRDALQLAWTGQLVKAHSYFYWTISARTDPGFLTTDALFRLARNDVAGARSCCLQALALAPQHHRARFFLLLTSYDDPRANLTEIGAPLFGLDWRASEHGEFYAYAARLLLGHIPANAANLGTAESRWERAMLNYVGARMAWRKQQRPEAVRWLAEAWRGADLSDPISLIIAGEIDRQRQARARQEDWRPTAPARFVKDVRLSRDAASLLEQMSEHPATAARLMRLDPMNAASYQAAQCYYWTQQGEWAKAREASLQFLRQPRRRDSANYLAMTLFHAQLMAFSNPRQSRDELTRFVQQVPATNWYARVARCLEGHGELADEADQDGLHAVTLYTALGLKAEAERNRRLASRCYLQVVASRQTNFMEYTLALARLKEVSRSE